MNDDLVDKSLRQMLREMHTSLSAFIWTQISAFVKIDARFDPGLLAWTYSLFDIFDNRAAYKLVVGALLAISVLLICMCIAVITQSWTIALLFVFTVSGVLQIRLWADGITSFAGVMTLTTALTFGALLLLLTMRSLGWILLAGLLYLLALITYETVILLAPALIAVIVLSKKDWSPAVMAIAIPAILALLTAVSLRLFTNPHPVPEYTLSLVPHAVITTFAKQTLAALPLSKWWLGHYVGIPPIAGTLIIMSTILVGLPVFMGVFVLSQNLRLPSERAARTCALLGVWMWLAPATLVAVTERWQQEMPWGEGYISVVYEYFGVALCLVAVWLFTGSKAFSRNADGLGIRTWRLAGAVSLGFLATMTVAANFSLVP
jgi:hypothetical protein